MDSIQRRGFIRRLISVSEDSQRDEALKSQGVLWLILPGIPGAHLMILFNK